MLVLALQFSRGSHRRWPPVETTVAGTPRQRSACAHAGDEGNSLKTEEKTKFGFESSREVNLRSRRCEDEPTSAPTGNWFAPGRTNVYQRWNGAP